MKNYKYIKNGKPRVPIISAMVVYLMLEKFSAPEWLYGVFGIIYLVGIITAIALIIYGEQVDLFEEEDKPINGSTKKKSYFQTRLEQMAKDRGYKMPNEE
jgi:hypothetical protein